jgi:hypothetical protein
MVDEPLAEQWKVFFESYEISDQGRCRRRLKTGKYTLVNGSVSNRGYRYFQVQRDGKRLNKQFHHVVAAQFIGPRPDRLVIDHIDQCKTNNSVSNLRYITQQENMCNTSRYRHDLPIDPIERRRAMQLEYRLRKKQC